MIKKVAAIFSIVIGIAMVSIWILLLTSGQVPEVTTEPIRIAVHIFSEYLTAVLLLISGIGMLCNKKWADKVFPVSMGMLMYSVLTGVGLYTQQGNYAMTAMFTLFFVLAIVFTVLVRHDQKRNETSR